MLNSLDLAGCKNLIGLSCSNNKLNKIIINDKAKLESLNCSNNQITDLDLSGCPLLSFVHCEGNKLTDLNIFANPGLVRAFKLGPATQEDNSIQVYHDDYYEEGEDSGYNYELIADKNVKISAEAPVKSPVSVANASISGISDAVYNGSAIKPMPIVKVDGVTLKENTDYTLTYANNINAGTASITVTGKGNYSPGDCQNRKNRSSWYDMIRDLRRKILGGDQSCCLAS